MELISQRVASGLSIKPPKKPKKPQNRNVETISIQSQTEQKPVDWKKWGERAALGKAWANDGKRLFTGDEVRARLFVTSVIMFLMCMYSGAKLVHGHHATPLCLNQCCCTACPARALRRIVSYASIRFIQCLNSVSTSLPCSTHFSSRLNNAYTRHILFHASNVFHSEGDHCIQ
jgi:hypothetical protein